MLTGTFARQEGAAHKYPIHGNFGQVRIIAIGESCASCYNYEVIAELWLAYHLIFFRQALLRISRLSCLDKV
jgi:hypothetical protein